jgi:FtsZ-interacting cell division protein YlmF
MEAIVALKQQKTVVLNLSLMPAEEAQRAADFVSGAPSPWMASRSGSASWCFCSPPITLT